jgi:outer membrane lipoprotein-sorting protein
MSSRSRLTALAGLAFGAMVFSSGFTVHGSRFTVHDSRLTVHDSRFTIHGSRLTLHGSRRRNSETQNREPLTDNRQPFSREPSTQDHEPSETPDTSLAEELKRIDALAAAIEDLTADFVQQKYTVLLRQPLTSRGTVRVRGALMRWDTTEPSPSVTVMDENRLRIHYPKQRTVEEYRLDERLSDMASSPLPRLNSLQEHFAITRGETRDELHSPHLPLRLAPKHKQLAEYVREVNVAIDLQQGYLLWMQVLDVDDERTEITFSKHRINTGLSRDDLELKVPRGSRVVRPLDDLRDGSSDDGSPPPNGQRNR